MGQGKSKNNHDTVAQQSGYNNNNSSQPTQNAKPNQVTQTNQAKRTEANNNNNEAKSSLQELFTKYADLSDDPADQIISGEGIMRFCEDIGVDPMQITLMVLFWKLKLEEKYTITKDEFITGFKRLRMENLSSMKEGIPQLKNELNSRSSFKEFYLWCFNYMKDPAAKTLPVDLAVPTWKLIMQGRYKHIDDWCKFIEEVHKKAVSYDTWEQFLDFTLAVGTDFSKYDPDGAWPVAIDEFVEQMQSKAGTGTSTSVC